jgi:hypothetical protein
MIRVKGCEKDSTLCCRAKANPAREILNANHGLAVRVKVEATKEHYLEAERRAI